MSHPSHPIQPEVITSSGHIRALLQRMVTERLFVRLHLISHNSREALLSTLLQVRHEDGVLLLDAPFPRPSQPLLQGLCLRVEAITKGAILCFETELESQVEEEGMPLWRLHLPTAVEYGDLRQEHRLSLAELGVPICLFDSNGTAIEGILGEISMHGLALRLQRANGLKRGGVYRCLIAHHEAEWLEWTVEAKWAQKCVDKPPVLLGAEPQLGDRHQQIQWQRLVKELERRMLRQGQAEH